MEKKEEVNEVNDIKKTYDFYFKAASIFKVILIGLAILTLIGGLISLNSVSALEKDEDYYEEIEGCEDCDGEDTVLYTIGEDDTPTSVDNEDVKSYYVFAILFSLVGLVVSAILIEKHFKYKSYTLQLLDEINTNMNKKK